MILFGDNVIFEYTTKKAALKMAERIVNGAIVKKSFKSKFGYFLKPGQPIFQVCENEKK